MFVLISTRARDRHTWTAAHCPTVEQQTQRLRPLPWRARLTRVQKCELQRSQKQGAHFATLSDQLSFPACAAHHHCRDSYMAWSGAEGLREHLGHPALHLALAPPPSPGASPVRLRCGVRSPTARRTLDSCTAWSVSAASSLAHLRGTPAGPHQRARVGARTRPQERASWAAASLGQAHAVHCVLGSQRLAASPWRTAAAAAAPKRRGWRFG